MWEGGECMDIYERLFCNVIRKKMLHICCFVSVIAENLAHEFEIILSVGTV